MRNVKLFAVAFVLATGAFWFVMATEPPKTIAETSRPSISLYDMVTPAGLKSPDGADAF
jgi:hypothetical protein